MDREQMITKYKKLLNDALVNWDSAKENGNTECAEYWSGCITAYRKIVNDLEEE